MNREKAEYLGLAKKLEEEFKNKQGANLLANLNKKNVEGLDVTQDKILKDIRNQLYFYEDSEGNNLSEEEMDYVLELVKREIWGYGLIDELIRNDGISDIKLYRAGNIRIKSNGSRGGSDAAFADERDYRAFIIKNLEKNKVNLGTANAIQTYTDDTQEGFILRITIISGLLVDGGNPVMAIRKIPKDKYTLKKLQSAGMFDDTVKREEKKAECNSNRKFFENDERLDALINKMIASKGILFTGKGASGKTTLMNAMIAAISFDESVMICQENAELFDLDHPDLFSCHVMTNSGDSKISYTLGDLTRAALLMDLDRVIVGEVKEGSEAAGLSKASMTGHKCWTSVHGESCEMAVDKIADYISQATGYSTRDSLKQLQGFEYVVHLKDFNIDEIIKIAGWDKEKEELVYERVYPFARKES